MVCLLGDSIFRVGKITTFLGKNYRLVNSKNRKQSPRGVLRKNCFVKFSFISEKWGGFLFKIMLHAWHRSFIKKKRNHRLCCVFLCISQNGYFIDQLWVPSCVKRNLNFWSSNYFSIFVIDRIFSECFSVWQIYQFLVCF